MSDARPPLLSAPDAAIMEHVPTLSQSALAATSSSRSSVPFEELYDISRTAERVLAVEPLPRSVVLQFPDEALQDSVPIFWALQRRISALASKKQLDWQGRLYVAADTSYGNCCVDEVTAQHVDADLVVHYGHACLSPTRRLPVIYVFPKLPIEVQLAASALVAEVQPLVGTSDQSRCKQAVLLLYDVSYAHAAAEVNEQIGAQLSAQGINLSTVLTHLETEGNIAESASAVTRHCDSSQSASSEMACKDENGGNGACCNTARCGTSATCQPSRTSSQRSINQSSDESSMRDVQHMTGIENGLGSGRRFSLPDGVSLEDTVVCYLGGESLALTNLLLRLSSSVAVVSYDPRRPSGKDARQETGSTNKLLMKRYVAVQRTRDAKVVALLVGTLGVAAYLPLLSHLRKRLQETGRRVYTISVGKLTPAKLANFQEIDVFVLLACPENSLVDAVDALPNATDKTGRTHSSRDFYKPIVSPFELLHALKEEAEGTHSWSGKYELELSTLLRDSKLDSRTAESSEKANERNGAGSDEEPHYSLITGGYVSRAQKPAREHFGSSATSQALSKEAKPAAGEVVVRNSDGTLTRVLDSSAGRHLANRTWRGLQGRPAGAAPSVLAVGRAGTAGGYADTSGLAEGREGVGAGSRIVASSKTAEPASPVHTAIECSSKPTSELSTGNAEGEIDTSDDEEFDLEPL
ncbi:Diphthamide biosynthesis protein [Ceraceosorus bombacis]|uniref:Diphthamide biosynthesis protein n=1 Tax=Ceraceosorus bombacis TaxID=401625 RepID=A0A0P1BP78_9BASI|nr:Diphthamide biosynthesis protein [Ceraceosorus bombacis]